MNLTSKELTLITSSLEADTLGNWGDGRNDEIKALLKKIKKERRRLLIERAYAAQFKD
jgi:hypothetical protein